MRFEAKVSKHEREHAKAFVQIIRVKMEEVHFHPKATSEFLSAFQELIDNGFQHGCKTASDSITLRVVLFGAGVSAEAINNNKSAKIPKLDSLPEPSKLHCNGLRFAMSVIDQISTTHDDRGVKIVMYQRDESTYLDEEGITFVQLGGFASDVEFRIKNALSSQLGKVVLVFGKHEPIAHSMAALSFDEMENRDSVTEFAIVGPLQALGRLNQFKDIFPKLVGCYASPEEAIAALKPEQKDPTNSTKKKPKAGKRGSG